SAHPRRVSCASRSTPRRSSPSEETRGQQSRDAHYLAEFERQSSPIVAWASTRQCRRRPIADRRCPASWATIQTTPSFRPRPSRLPPAHPLASDKCCRRQSRDLSGRKLEPREFRPLRFLRALGRPLRPLRSGLPPFPPPIRRLIFKA